MTELTHRDGAPFDAIRQVRDDDSEFWSARDLCSALEYDQWRNFTNAVEKARMSIRNQGLSGLDHVADASKMVDLGLGTTREIEDFHLTRFAAYLVVMNGDPRKERIAEAQAYFAIKTREAKTVTQPQTLAERSLALLGELTSEVQRQAAVIESQAPLVAQATQYAAGAGDVIRSRFARDFISWAHKERGVTVKQPEVMAFLGRKLGLFVVGERSDAGEATIRAERDGLAHTKRGTSDSGHNYGTGVLTPAGQQYAWDRAVRYLDEHGTLELPRLTAVGA